MHKTHKKTVIQQLILSSLCFASLSYGATYTVSVNGDTGPNTLRQAVADANANTGADIIDIDTSLVGTPIKLSGAIEITDELTINGSGVTVDAGKSKKRIFKLTKTKATIDNLKLINGYERKQSGAAIYADSSSLTVTNAHFAENVSEKKGGAILVDALDGNAQALIIKNTVFTKNQSRQNGGAIAGEENVVITIENSYFLENSSLANSGGAVEFYKLSSGKHQVLNSTFETNSVKVNGGAISLAEAELFIENSTFYKNTSIGKGAAISTKPAGLVKDKIAILNVTRSTFFENNVDPKSRVTAGLLAPGLGGANVTVQNSIMVQTPDLVKRRRLCGQQVDSTYTAEYNVMSDDTCGLDSLLGNEIVADTTALTTILASTLADNGCKTKAGIDGEKACVKTMTLVDGSPAIDLGKATLRKQDFDQRGDGFTRMIGPIEDAGAFEYSTVKAKYDITVVVNPNTNSGELVCTPSTVNSGSDAKCTATAKSGYKFVKFELGCDVMNSNVCELTNVQAPKTITAVFESTLAVGSFSVTGIAAPISGGSVVCSPSSVISGGQVNCTAKANGGYSFDGFVSGDCTSESGLTCTVSNITSSKQVTANFVSGNPAPPHSTTESVPSLSENMLLIMTLVMGLFGAHRWARREI